MEPERPFANTIDRLEDIASLFLGMQGSPRFSMEPLNSDEAIFALASLVVSHVQGVIELARVNPPLLPAAAGCARAAFETAANLAWIAAPQDPAEREGRWLGWYAADARFWENLRNDLCARAPNESKYAGGIAAAKVNLVTGIARALQDHLGQESVAFPSLERRLASLGQESAYSVYRQASQVVHGMPDATGLVTSGGAHPQALRITWALVLRMACWSLNPLLVASVRIGVDPKHDEFQLLTRRFTQSVEALNI